jgi:transposase
MDISKRDVKVCVRTPGKRHRTFDKDISVWGATAGEVASLTQFLVSQRVTLVVMEATGSYWKPFYYPMEADLNVMLVNARHAKNLPGRKTDVSDAQWLAELGAHGLVRASFVPPEPIRELRDLTRARATFTRERTREIQRLEKLLEDAGLKLSSVATQITGVSGRAMLAALIDGQRDPAVLADLAKGRLRNKMVALTDALQGRFGDRHAFLAREHLERIDRLEESIQRLDERIGTAMVDYEPAVALLSTIPGVSTTTARVIIAETGADMTRFPTAAHLASWAGVCPGHNESAGKVKSSQVRPGNSYLKAALGIAAMAAARTNGTYLQARYKRLAARRGAMRALVATQHSMIVSIWNMLTTGEIYNELGADYSSRQNPGLARRRAVAQLTRLGYTVELTSIN